MSDTRLKEPFLAALGVLESLTDAWHSLPTDVTADTSLRDLIAKEGLSLFSKQASLLTSFDSLHRLFNVCGRLKVLGGPYFIQPTKLTFVLRKMIIQKMEEWDATKKTQIQRLDSLAQWAALTVSVEARSSKESVIVALWVGQTFAIEVSPLQADLAASRDSLRIVEIGVKLMRLLPEVHQQRVSKIPDEHIKALQASEVGSPEVIAGGHDNFTGKTVVGAREHSAFNKLEEITKGLEAQIELLQDRNHGIEMAIREVRQSCQILRDERFELGHQVRELTQALDTFRSSDSELRQEIHELKSSCNRLEGEKTELEKKLLSSKKCYQGTVRKPTDEVALIEQSLLEQTRGYDCDDKIYDESYKAQPEELSESLAEAEEVGTLLTQQIYNKWRASCRTLFGS